ncbi:hypothetical protein [Novosphingobium sp.]|uniref:hypothetical protein n=1 Tax=Novosphingobium sp. TaxID=1874826 RepID=UPI00273566D5|nr:hypothetical protein [Novosphingobium sp.]MDP3907393.1 hypothetical protein [Novosphingobium sp.]
MAHQYHLADLFETVAATVPDRVALLCADAVKRSAAGKPDHRRAREVAAKAVTAGAQ